MSLCQRICAPPINCLISTPFLPDFAILAPGFGFKMPSDSYAYGWYNIKGERYEEEKVKQDSSSAAQMFALGKKFALKCSSF